MKKWPLLLMAILCVSLSLSAANPVYSFELPDFIKRIFVKKTKQAITHTITVNLAWRGQCDPAEIVVVRAGPSISMQSGKATVKRFTDASGCTLSWTFSEVPDAASYKFSFPKREPRFGPFVISKAKMESLGWGITFFRM